MMRDLPQIEFVDTTLREGFQSSIELFGEHIKPAAYAKAAIASLNVSYLEIYGPGVYYSAEDYESVVEASGQQLQLYCGTVDHFDPAKKQHINNLLNPRLSLTVIKKNPTTIKKIQHILDCYPRATLRLGLECAGSTDTSTIMNFLKQLIKLERLDTITLSDSNGTMAPDAVRKMILGFSAPFTNTLGFHLHNDRGLAAANAVAAIEACAKVSQEKVSFDFTYGGLGERYGLLSLQEIAALGQDIIKGDTEQQIKKIGNLFTDEALCFHSLPYMKEATHVAASHFDANGNLRPEYRTPKPDTSVSFESYGQ